MFSSSDEAASSSCSFTESSIDPPPNRNDIVKEPIFQSADSDPVDGTVKHLEPETVSFGEVDSAGMEADAEGDDESSSDATVRKELSAMKGRSDDCKATIAGFEDQMRLLRDANEKACSISCAKTVSIDMANARIAQLEKDIAAVYVERLERAQRVWEIKNRCVTLVNKIQRCVATRDELQKEFQSMSIVSTRADKANKATSERSAEVKAQQQCVCQLKDVLSSVQNAVAHEEAIVEHLDGARNLSPALLTLERAMLEFCN